MTTIQTNTNEVTVSEDSALVMAQSLKALIEDLKVFKHTTYDFEGFATSDSERLYQTSISVITDLNDVDGSQYGYQYLVNVYEALGGTATFRALVDGDFFEVNGVPFLSLADALAKANELLIDGFTE